MDLNNMTKHEGALPPKKRWPCGRTLENPPSSLDWDFQQLSCASGALGQKYDALGYRSACDVSPQGSGSKDKNADGRNASFPYPTDHEVEAPRLSHAGCDIARCGTLASHATLKDGFGAIKSMDSPNSPQVLSRKFPDKLSAMLSTPSIAHIVSWLPDGRSWRIHNKKLFQEVVLPYFYESGSYNSFLRLVNAWGFTRIKSNNAKRDKNSVDPYFHELFVRDHPHLMRRMMRLRPNKGKGTSPLATKNNTFRDMFPTLSVEKPNLSSLHEQSVSTTATKSAANCGSLSGTVERDQSFCEGCPRFPSAAPKPLHSCQSLTSNDKIRALLDRLATVHHGLVPEINIISPTQGGIVGASPQRGPVLNGCSAIAPSFPMRQATATMNLPAMASGIADEQMMLLDQLRNMKTVSDSIELCRQAAADEWIRMQQEKLMLELLLLKEGEGKLGSSSR